LPSKDKCCSECGKAEPGSPQWQQRVKNRCRTVGDGHYRKGCRPRCREHGVGARVGGRVGKARQQSVLGGEGPVQAHGPGRDDEIARLDDQADVVARHGGLEQRVVESERAKKGKSAGVEQPEPSGLDERTDPDGKGGGESKPQAEAHRQGSGREIRQWRQEGEQHASIGTAGIW
jgi:hypothetical protein